MLVLKAPQSGSIAGTTASHNRYGQYERNRRSPTQSPTERRTAIRTLFAAASAAYSALSETLAAAWGAYASSHPVTNRLGQSVTLDGHAMYVRVNTARANSGTAVSDDVPTTDEVAFNPALASVAAGPAGLNVTVGNQGASTKVLIQAGPPRSLARTYEGLWSQLAVAPPSSAAAINVSEAYAARYGLPAPSKAVFVRLVPVSTEGVQGSPLVIRAEVSGE